MEIKIDNYSKKFRSDYVLRNITYTFTGGRIYGLYGENGSGKTMLMRAVSGLMYPTSGTIKIDGKVLGRDMAFPQKIGLLIENIFDMCDKGCLILLSSHIELWSKDW